MTTSRLTLLTLIIACAIPSARSQQLSWDDSATKEVETAITTLPPLDQRGIEHALDEQSESLRAMRINTSSGHIFFVQGLGDMLCSPTGNCNSWVLSSNYRILLTAIVQTFAIQPTAHHGYPDILTHMHGSASSGDLKQWRFNGTKYHHVACESYDYTDTNGNELKTPHITPEPCNPR